MASRNALEPLELVRSPTMSTPASWRNGTAPYRPWLLRAIAAPIEAGGSNAATRVGVPVRGLILDDFTLQALCQIETADCYKLVVERHRKTSTVITGNRDPSQWLGELSNSLLTQSAVDCLVATSCHAAPTAECHVPKRGRQVRPATAAVLRPRHGGCRRRRPQISATSTPPSEVANSTLVIVLSCSLSIDRPGPTEPQASAAY